MSRDAWGAVAAWAPILLLTVLFGFAIQWAVFAERGEGWEFLVRWPVLWLVYFLLGHSVGENLIAWFARRKRD